MLFAIIALIIASGMLSSSEIALTAVNEPRLRAMEKEKKWAVGTIATLKKTPQRILITILITNQIVNILATIYATLLGIHQFGEEHLGIFTIAFTVALIAFGSIIPKTVALRFPEKIAQITALPLRGFVILIMPVIWVFEKIAMLIRRVFKISEANMVTATENEIKAMLQIGAEEGVISEQEGIFIQQILKFTKTQVKDIMTLSKDIEAIERSTSKEDLKTFFDEHKHTHYPVYEEDLNNIKGIVDFHELVDATFRPSGRYPLKKMHFSSPVVVPGSASLSTLFRSLKDNKKRMAIVVDEHGQTIGVATLGDLLQEATGMRAKKEIPEPKLVKIDKNLWEADGEVTVGNINEKLKIDLDMTEHSVISLVVLEQLKRFPVENELVLLDQLEIKVIKLEKNLIKKVQLKKRYKRRKKST